MMVFGTLFFLHFFEDVSSIEMLSFDRAGNEGFSSETSSPKKLTLHQSQGRRHLKPFIALKRRDGLIAISLVSCLRMGEILAFSIGMGKGLLI